MTNTASTRDIRPPQPAGARYWLTRVIHGLVLGAAIASLEFAYYFPLVSERAGIGFGSFASLLLVWCGECAFFALAVGVAEYRVRPRELRASEFALSVALGAFGGALIWNTFTQLVLREHFGMRSFIDHLGQEAVWPALILYHSWMMLFFGGLVAAVQASQRRRARMLAVLQAAELRRATSQQQLARASLASLQARVDPDVLLEKLALLEQSYEVDPEAADRLLDELIASLRDAIADIRAPGTAIST